METRRALAYGTLTQIHHIAFNVKDLARSRQFYGDMLGLDELKGDRVPTTLRKLVDAGKIANFITPDGLVIDLFEEPELNPPHADPTQQFTRANHLAFNISPHEFDGAVAVLQDWDVRIDHGPVSRPTGKGIYFYDPDGFLLEIRCDPETAP